MFDHALLEEATQEKGSSSSFPATRWSLVLGAQGSHAKTAGEALAQLCQLYWYPLYAYARRCGNAPADAEDITQGFFAFLIGKDTFNKVDRKHGKLRSFLLASLKRYMRDKWRAAYRLKRGGDHDRISFDKAEAESKYHSQMVANMTPETAYRQGPAFSTSTSQKGDSGFWEKLATRSPPTPIC